MNDTVKSEASTKPKKWFQGLDSLRFLLAFSVLLSHFHTPTIDALKSSDNPAIKIIIYIYSLVFVGPPAVIAFFVISGFVIHHPYRNRDIQLVSFYIRRFVRVVIPLIIIVAIGSFYNHPESAVTWSLYCELIYYTIYPFLKKIPVSWNVKLIASCVICGAVIILKTPHELSSFLHRKDEGYLGGYWQLGVLYTWIVGLPCWLTGVKLAEIIDKEPRRVSFYCLIFLRFAAWGAAILLQAARFHYFLSYMYSLNFLCILFFFWLKAEINYYRYNEPSKLLEKWGKFSYSLYLCHPLLIAIINSFFEVTIYNYLLFTGLIILVSYLFFLLVENNSHRLAKKWASLSKASARLETTA